MDLVADDSLLVRNESLSGNPVFLVVRYEYTPGFGDPDTLATGGKRLHNKTRGTLQGTLRTRNRGEQMSFFEKRLRISKPGAARAVALFLAATLVFNLLIVLFWSTGRRLLQTRKGTFHGFIG